MSNLSTLLQTMSDLSGTLTTPGGTVIYENQIRAGRSIVDCFTNDQHSTILFSQFQAGKTGVAVYVAMEMTGQTGQSDGSGLAEEVFFVCGMNDLSIKRQAQSRFHGLKNVTILFNYDIQRMVDEKVRLTDRKILVIVDESQFGSSRQSELHKLLIEVFGIDPAVEHYNWANQKSYYLSISATPFTEEVANHLFKPSKTIIRLEPGRGYRGVKYLLEHNFIQESFKLETPDDYSRLVNLLGFDEPGYYIIRLENEAYRADCESYLKSATGGSTFVLTSKGSTLKLTSDNFINLHCKNEEVTMNINDYLTREPDRPIIIFIYRSLSASYTPYFRYVNAGFEAAGEAIKRQHRD
jgi:hypothetical protein